MRTFTCYCGNRLYFENSRCLRCGRQTAFDPESLVMSALEPQAEGTWLALSLPSDRCRVRLCQNTLDFDTCNWLVNKDSSHTYCLACRMNSVIPDLTKPRRVALWFKVEQAKRRLLFTLLSLRVPVLTKQQNPTTGLAFQILADERLDADSIDADTHNQVTTGHYFGCITINLMEADDSIREQMRERMNESYRTLLGHFRHESGHYYWFLLVDNSPWLEPFRALFGDERADYAEALASHHAGEEEGSDWQKQYISRYATTHPWEDFGETWAHYLHIVDTLETAWDANFEIEGQRLNSPLEQEPLQYGLGLNRESALQAESFPSFLEDWFVLSAALNRLNRSMGLPDAYPFVLSKKAIQKLTFVDQLVRQAALPVLFPESPLDRSD